MPEQDDPRLRLSVSGSPPGAVRSRRRVCFASPATASFIATRVSFDARSRGRSWLTTPGSRRWRSALISREPDTSERASSAHRRASVAQRIAMPAYIEARSGSTLARGAGGLFGASMRRGAATNAARERLLTGFTNDELHDRRRYRGREVLLRRRRRSEQESVAPWSAGRRRGAIDEFDASFRSSEPTKRCDGGCS
jgi:hypothetical protein